MTALAAIHVARKQLGLDDDTARDLYQRVTGKRSARDMSEAERQNVVEELRRQGFSKQVSKGRRKKLEGRFAPKLQALWIAAWNLGIVENRADEALVAFVKRQTGIDHVRFLRHPEDAAKAIEALKAWMAREAGVDWSPSKTLPPTMNDERFRVAWAQYRIIVPGATYMGNLDGFWRECGRIVTARWPDADLSQLRPDQWQRVMNTLGELVRMEKGS